MKAIICTRYGSPDVLQLQQIEKQNPKDDEVLIKVCAASLNAADLDFLQGTLLVRFGGLLKPKYKIPGSDVAGRVNAVGSKVKRFQPGDEVFGDLFACGFGAFAEFVCAPERVLELKPKSMSFEQAATFPQAAVIALQGLRDKRQITPGQRVLINGAGGGMGTFAVQLAKYFGAEVTGVDSTGKMGMLRTIGADYVIDYTKEDFTKNRQHYDLVLDVAAHHSIFDYKRALSSEGVYVMVGGSRNAILQALFLGPLVSAVSDKRMGINMWKPFKKQDVDFLKEVFEVGKVAPIIDRCYPLSEIVDALWYLKQGQHKGKIVITIAD